MSRVGISVYECRVFVAREEKVLKLCSSMSVMDPAAPHTPKVTASHMGRFLEVLGQQPAQFTFFLIQVTFVTV